MLLFQYNLYYNRHHHLVTTYFLISLTTWRFRDSAVQLAQSEISVAQLNELDSCLGDC